jgi:GTP-binding protein
LRHIERTRILFHFISSESLDLAADYETIRNELRTYNKELIQKKEYLFLTKSDLLSPADLKKKLAVLKKLNKTTIAVSIADEKSVEKIKKILNTIKAAK